MDDTNNKRELGQIQATLIHIQTDVREIKDEVGKTREQLTDHSISEAKLERRIMDNEKELNYLRRRSDGWNIGNSVMALAAGVVAWIKA